MTDKTLICAYIDGELETDEHKAVETMIATDDSWKAEYEAQSQVKRILGSKLSQSDNPELWRECLSRFAKIESANRTQEIVHRFRFALAGVVAIAICAGAYLNRFGVKPSVGDTLHRSISASVATLPGLSTISQDEAVAFVGKELGTDVQIPTIRNGGLELIGRDVIPCDDCPVGRFVFTDRRSLYFLLFLKTGEEFAGTPIPGADGFEHLAVGKLNAISWIEREKRIVFAGPAPVRDLIQMIR
jgi:hypothetical protein